MPYIIHFLAPGFLNNEGIVDQIITLSRITIIFMPLIFHCFATKIMQGERTKRGTDHRRRLKMHHNTPNKIRGTEADICRRQTGNNG